MATTYYTRKPVHLRTFLLGVARRPGEVVPVPRPESLGAYDRQALEAHFERAGGGADAGGADAPPVLRNGLTEEQARAAARGGRAWRGRHPRRRARGPLRPRVAPPGGGAEPPAITDADGPDGASGGPDDAPGADKEPPAKQQQRKNK